MDKDFCKEINKGKNYCLRLLAIRSRTENEIESRLTEKGYEDRARKDILDALKVQGYIDDLKFVREWVDSRIKFNPRSSRLIRDELLKKGVTGALIEKVFSEKADTLDEKAMAERLIREKIEITEFAGDAKAKGKMFLYLSRKGFDSETAEEVINEIMI